MRKTKKNEPKVQTRTVYLCEGMSLADVLKQVLADGVTDLSTVRYDHDYDGGCCNNEYCYCDSSYRDMRFRFEVKT